MEPTRSHNDILETVPSPSGETPTQPPRWRRILVRTLQFILLAYIALVLFRIPHVIEKEKTDAVVAQIHATKLTMDDVMGTNLPPDPGALADATIVGVDANANGIRDDVELAIFRDYATSSKTRAVLLQYAQSQQTQMSLPVLNTTTVTVTVEDINTRANRCILAYFSERREALDLFLKTTENDPSMEQEGMRRWNEHMAGIDSMFGYVNSLQTNTPERRAYWKKFNPLLRSTASTISDCDIELSTLPD